MARRFNRFRVNKQLDASLKYKRKLRDKGIPLRDDLARASFASIIGRLALFRRRGETQRFEKTINGLVALLPDRFDKGKSDALLRHMVAKYEEQRVNSATDSTG